MAFIKEGVLKKYSVLLPYIGGVLSLALVLIQSAIDNQLIPVEQQLIVASLVIPGLAHLGRKIKQSSDCVDDETEG